MKSTIEQYLEIGERFSVDLQYVNRFESQLAMLTDEEREELAYPEEYLDELRTLKRWLRKVEAGLVAVTEETAQVVKRAGGNASLVLKCTLAAEKRYNDQYHAIWFDLKPELEALLVAPGKGHPHEYKQYFDEYTRANPGLKNDEAAAARSYWNLKLCKNEKSKMVAGKGGDKEKAIESFIRKFKYRLK